MFVLRDELNFYLEHIEFECDGAYTFPEPELLQRAYLETAYDSPLRNEIVRFAVEWFFVSPVDKIAIPAVQGSCDEFSAAYMTAIDEHIFSNKCDHVWCKVHNREEFKKEWNC